MILRMDKFQLGGQITSAVGGGALDAPLLLYYAFALVFSEYMLPSAGPPRAPAPTMKSDGPRQIAV